MRINQLATKQVNFYNHLWQDKNRQLACSVYTFNTEEVGMHVTFSQRRARKQSSPLTELGNNQTKPKTNQKHCPHSPRKKKSKKTPNKPRQDVQNWHVLQ